MTPGGNIMTSIKPARAQAAGKDRFSMPLRMPSDQRPAVSTTAEFAKRPDRAAVPRLDQFDAGAAGTGVRKPAGRMAVTCSASPFSCQQRSIRDCAGDGGNRGGYIRTCRRIKLLRGHQNLFVLSRVRPDAPRAKDDMDLVRSATVMANSSRSVARARKRAEAEAYASCSIVTATSAFAESRTWVPSTSAMRLESMK